MPLISLGLLKHDISPMQVVQHPQYPIALVEPEMVVVMELRRRYEGQVVATVGEYAGDESQR